MKRIFLILCLIAAGVACSSVTAQQSPAKTVVPKATTQAHDSLKLTPSPELQKSLDELTVAVQALALRIASDPQLKAAALQVASGFVATAQQLVNEQTVVLQQTLKTAAERIAAEQSAHRNPAKKQ